MWSLRGLQAIDESICCFGPQWPRAGGAALGLSGAQLAVGSALGLSRTPLVCRLGPVRGAASLCSRYAPTRRFRCGPQATHWGTRPLGHFGSGAKAAGPLIRACAHPEFQLWAPSLLIWLRAAGLQVIAGAAFLCSQSRG